MIEGELECPICYFLFDEGAHCPLVASCGHTFCRECAAHCFTADAAECPNDRQPIQLPPGGARDLPKNYAFLSLLSTTQAAAEGGAGAAEEDEGSTSSAHTCTVCPSQHPAVTVCLDCDEIMCEAMAQVHRRMRATAMHRLSPLEDREAREALAVVCAIADLKLVDLAAAVQTAEAAALTLAEDCKRKREGVLKCFEDIRAALTAREASILEGISETEAVQFAALAEHSDYLRVFQAAVAEEAEHGRTALAAAAAVGEAAQLRRACASLEISLGEIGDQPPPPPPPPALAAFLAGDATFGISDEMLETFAAEMAHLIETTVLSSGDSSFDSGGRQSNQSYRTELILAARTGDLAKVNAYLEAGLQVDQADKEGVTPLFVGAQNGHLEVVKALLERGAQVDQSKKNGSTPLFIAAKNDHLEVIQVLLERGAQVDKVDKADTSPLLIAARNGRLEVAKALLERGAEVDKADDCGWTPLYGAAYRGHLEVVQALLERGAQVDQANKDGVFPLFVAAREGHLEIAKALLERGAEVDKADKDGWTPLFAAAWAGNSHVIRVLLASGADRQAASTSDRLVGVGSIPLAVAEATGHAECADLLR